MKLGIILLYPAVFWITCIAQGQDNVKQLPVKVGTVRIALEGNEYFRSGKIPFNKIIVYDYRFDTSKLGYFEYSQRSFEEIKLKQSWTVLLNRYFKNNLDASSPSTLFLFIRSYWLKRGIFDELSNKKIKQRAWGEDLESAGACLAAIDVYSGNDSTMKALFRVEESFLNFYNFNKTKIDNWIFLPFDSVVHRLQREDVAGLTRQKRDLRLSEVHAHYANRLNLPVLNTPVRKGVFLSFNDFKKNQPYETEFKLKTSKLTDELYAVTKNSEELLADYWGFYDGTSLFIRSGYNVFPAIRLHNTFEILGAKYISHVHNNPQPGDLIPVNKLKLDKKILQLNMETGKFY